MTANGITPARSSTRILILGGGYVGLYAALTLRKKLRRQLRAGRASIAIVDPRAYMTYQPFLPEAAAGSLEPRHVVAGLRMTLPGVTILPGRIAKLDHAIRTATVAPLVGEDYDVHYDEVIVALGSVARTLPIPGLAERGMGFKQIEEAIDLRNQVLGMMENASAVWDADQRRRMLTFTFVGGGFAGIEALGEIEDMARAHCAHFDSIRREDLRFVLIEASDKILPEVGPQLGAYALEQLRERGIDVKLNTRLESAVGGRIVCSDGDEFDSETLVWTAGVKANPALAGTDLPLEERGRVRTNAALQVIDEAGTVLPGAWAAGDVAAVPDLTKPGTLCGPTAQHAVRQARRLGKNLVANLADKPTTDYRHRDLGTVAALGLYKGVATIFGLKLRGPLAWFFHRTYHMLAMPTVNRKIHVVLDWTMALLFRRQSVPLGALATPRAEFRSVATPTPTPPDAATLDADH